MANQNQHRGSNFDDFLKEDGIFEEVQAKALKRALSEQLDDAMQAINLSKVDMAKRMEEAGKRMVSGSKRSARQVAAPPGSAVVGTSCCSAGRRPRTRYPARKAPDRVTIAITAATSRRLPDRGLRGGCCTRHS